jgi:Amt family ammonium transporter
LDSFLVNNLWVLLSALLVFTMTLSVGLLEVGELGEGFARSLLKAFIIACSGLFFMAVVGFNTAFAPTVLWGLIGNPLYAPGLVLGGFSSGALGLLGGTWWSVSSVGLSEGTYFLFEAAFASVTLALVGVIVLRKMRLTAFTIYSAVYFILIWALPAAWIWNPSGWLYSMGFRDFAGGLVVHAAAGAAGLGILLQIWREERRKKYRESPQTRVSVSPAWLAVAMLLLWAGWFGFNGGSVLQFNGSAMTVVVVTFLAAATSACSALLFRYIDDEGKPDLLSASNGVLMGLIVITPLAGFVSPVSAMIIGVLAGGVFVFANRALSRARWFSDPVGLLPGHMVGGIFGVLMIAFFTQASFAAASGSPGLPNGILFGGGMQALSQLGIEAFGIAAVVATVFVLSFATCAAISAALGGITRDYKEKKGF